MTMRQRSWLDEGGEYTTQRVVPGRAGTLTLIGTLRRVAAGLYKYDISRSLDGKTGWTQVQVRGEENLILHTHSFYECSLLATNERKRIGDSIS